MAETNMDGVERIEESPDAKKQVIKVQSIVRAHLVIMKFKSRLKKFRHRCNIVQEILDKQRNFVSFMTRTVQNYMIPLQQQKKIVSDDLIATIFGNLDEIINVDTELLATLEEECATPATAKIPFLRTYTAYIDGYDKRIVVLNDCMKQKPFVKFVEDSKRRESCGGLTLAGLLIMPIQHIPRLKLLVEQVLKYTDSSHPDFEELEEANLQLHETAEMFEQSVKDRENRDRMIELHSKFIGLQEEELPILQPSRRIVRSGQLTPINFGVGKKRNCWVFLFNDCLAVVGKDADNAYHRRILMPVVGVRVEEVMDGERSFRISNAVCSLTLQASTEKDRRDWISDIKMAEVALSERAADRHSGSDYDTASFDLSPGFLSGENTPSKRFSFMSGDGTLTPKRYSIVNKHMSSVRNSDRDRLSIEIKKLHEVELLLKTQQLEQAIVTKEKEIASLKEAHAQERASLQTQLQTMDEEARQADAHARNTQTQMETELRIRDDQLREKTEELQRLRVELSTAQQELRQVQIDKETAVQEVEQLKQQTQMQEQMQRLHAERIEQLKAERTHLRAQLEAHGRSLLLETPTPGYSMDSTPSVITITSDNVDASSTISELSVRVRVTEEQLVVLTRQAQDTKTENDMLHERLQQLQIDNELLTTRLNESETALLEVQQMASPDSSSELPSDKVATPITAFMDSETRAAIMTLKTRLGALAQHREEALAQLAEAQQVADEYAKQTDSSPADVASLQRTLAERLCTKKQLMFEATYLKESQTQTRGLLHALELLEGPYVVSWLQDKVDQAQKQRDSMASALQAAKTKLGIMIAQMDPVSGATNEHEIVALRERMTEAEVQRDSLWTLLTETRSEMISAHSCMHLLSQSNDRALVPVLEQQLSLLQNHLVFIQKSTQAEHNRAERILAYRQTLQRKTGDSASLQSSLRAADEEIQSLQQEIQAGQIALRSMQADLAHRLASLDPQSTPERIAAQDTLRTLQTERDVIAKQHAQVELDLQKSCTLDSKSLVPMLKQALENSEKQVVHLQSQIQLLETSSQTAVLKQLLEASKEQVTQLQAQVQELSGRVEHAEAQASSSVSVASFGASPIHIPQHSPTSSIPPVSLNSIPSQSSLFRERTTSLHRERSVPSVSVTPPPIERVIDPVSLTNMMDKAHADEARIRELELELLSLQHQLTAAKEQVKYANTQLETERKQLSSNASMTQDMNNQLQQQITARDQQFTELKASLKQAQQSLQDTLSNLQARDAEIQSKDSEIQELKDSSEASSNRVRELEVKIRTWSEAMTKFTEEQRRKDSELSNLRTSYNQVVEQVNQLMGHEDQLLQTVESLKAQIVARASQPVRSTSRPARSPSPAAADRRSASPSARRESLSSPANQAARKSAIQSHLAVQRRALIATFAHLLPGDGAVSFSLTPTRSAIATTASSVSAPRDVLEMLERFRLGVDLVRRALSTLQHCMTNRVRGEESVQALTFTAQTFVTLVAEVERMSTVLCDDSEAMAFYRKTAHILQSRIHACRDQVQDLFETLET